jgi:hypothetical protein
MGIRSRGSTFFVALALCAGAAILATPASSSAAAEAPLGFAGPARGIVQPFAAQHGSALFGARNWAGYITYPSPVRTDFNLVKATWRQPAVHCQSAQAWTAFWVGMDGLFSPSTVEQGGSYAYCPTRGGAPQYWVWWEMWPSNSIQRVFQVRAGDTIFGSVKYVAAEGIFSIYVKDLTTRRSFTAHARCGRGLTCARSSAQVITEDIQHAAGGGYYPLANFGSATYTNVGFTDVRGSAGPISSGHWNNALINAADRHTVYAVTSALSPHGSAFKVTWRHS